MGRLRATRAECDQGDGRPAGAGVRSTDSAGRKVYQEEECP